MKKQICIILTACMIFALASCGQGDIRDTYGLSSEDIAVLVNAID